MVDLQFNYPILPGQAGQFGELLREIADESEDAIRLAPWGGHARHRAAAAEWLSRRGTHFPCERVLIGSGGHNGVMASLLCLGLIGKKIAVDPLTYSGFKGQAAAIESEMLPCEGDSEGMLPAALDSAAKAGARGVYLMPTVHNPLGTVMPRSRREAIVGVAREHDLLIIDDDAYGFMDENPPANFAELAPERGIYIQSLTKPFAPVMKIAFIVVPERLSDAMAEKLRALSSGASALLAETTIRVAENGTLEGIVREKRREAAARQKIAAEAFHGLRTRAHPTSYHLWIEMPDGVKAGEVETRIYQRGIQVVPAKYFAGSTSVAESGIRVALGAVRDEIVLRESLHAVAQEIRR